MRDDFHGQVWAEHHKRVADMIHKIFTATMAAFVRLNATQFDAPWKHEAKPSDCK